MATYTVSDDKLNTPEAADYMASRDRRIMIGFRDALEALGIPVPDYARRQPPVRIAARVLATQYDADNPSYRPLAYRPPRYASPRT